MLDEITSRTNRTVRLVRSLYERRSVRHRERLFVAEGLRTVATLIEQGCPLKTLLIDSDRRDDIPSELVDAAVDRDATTLLVAHDVFSGLADVETPQAIIGVFGVQEPRIPDAPSFVVALDGIQDPGNLGSIFRTCVASGVEAALLLPGTVDVYNPKVVRSTAGFFSKLPMMWATSTTALNVGGAKLPERVVVADSAATTSYTAFDWKPPFVLVIGGEASGVRHDWSKVATDRVRIEMAGGVESLNVAAAAAVLMFEARRQRSKV